MKSKGVKTDEMPLGDVSVNRMRRCMDIIAEIKTSLHVAPDQRDAMWKARLQKFSNDFYQQLPQTSTDLINTTEKMQTKADLVTMLMDIAIGQV